MSHNSQPIPLYDNNPEPAESSSAEKGEAHLANPAHSPEEDLKAFALKRGAVAVGIAEVEAIKQQAPAGHQPSDLMMEARNVIVIGIAQSGGELRLVSYWS